MPQLSRREFTVSVLGAAAAAAARVESAGAVRQPRAQVPAASRSSDALAALTLAEASARIRAGSVTSADLVNACLTRIEIYNPKINAFITVTREAALADSRARDGEQRAGKVRGPLHGIPTACK